MAVLWHAVVGLNVIRRTKKRVADSRYARADLLATVN